MSLRVLRRLLGAQAFSSAGTSISTIALVIMVGELTGSALQMGGVMAVATFPLIITSWVGGALLDRFSAKRAMVIADLARAALILSLPFLAETSTGFIYGVAGLVGVFSAVFNPGQIKLTSELVEHDDLVKANSYLSVARDGAELMGYLAGGALVAAVGYKLAFALDALSYLASAVLLVGLPKPAPRVGVPTPIRRLMAEYPQVFMRLWRHPGLRTNLLLAVFPVMFVMISMPLSYALVLEEFQAGDWAVGVLEGAIAGGLIVGGLAISRMALKKDKNMYVLLALMVVAACLVGIRFSDYLWLSIVLMGAGGIANVGVFVPSVTLYQESCAECDMGRVMAVRAGLGQVGSTAGFLLGGFLGHALGIRTGFMVAGLAVMAASVLIYLPYRLGGRERKSLAAKSSGGDEPAGAPSADSSQAGRRW